MEGWFSTIAAIGVINGFCLSLDWFLSKAENRIAKDSVVKWWVGLGTFSYYDSIRKSNASLNSLFDTIYGKKFFSWRSFLLSCISSIVGVTLIANIYLLLNIKPFPAIDNFSAGVLASCFVLNFWIDYLSLLETRFILKLARKGGLFRLLIFDLLVSSLIFQVGMFLLFIAATLISGDAIRWKMTFVFIDVPLFIKYYVMNFDYAYGVCYFSTFLTSAIFYLYCMSTLYFKAFGLFRTRLMNLLENLESKDRLFRAIGVFLSGVVLFMKCSLSLWEYHAK